MSRCYTYSSVTIDWSPVKPQAQELALHVLNVALTSGLILLSRSNLLSQTLNSGSTIKLPDSDGCNKPPQPFYCMLCEKSQREPMLGFSARIPHILHTLQAPCCLPLKEWLRMGKELFGYFFFFLTQASLKLWMKEALLLFYLGVSMVTFQLEKANVRRCLSFATMLCRWKPHCRHLKNILPRYGTVLCNFLILVCIPTHTVWMKNCGLLVPCIL